MSGNSVPEIERLEHRSVNGVDVKAVTPYIFEGGSLVPQTGSAPNYAIQVDDTSTANVTYVGKAAIASVTSAAVWQVFKVNTASGVVLTWADGNDNFDNIWDNRTSLTYS